MVYLKRLVLLLAFVFLLTIEVVGQNRYELSGNWKYKRITEVDKEGKQISLQSYNIDEWEKAKVPGTILTSQLENGDIPDPFYGMNNEEIPDIYDVGNTFYTYWFVTEFEQSVEGNEQVWLTFRGINYRAEVYLNGKKVNHEVFEGMFLRRTFNVTHLLDTSGPNRLAVLIHPMPFPGEPNGGQAGDGTIARNVAHQYPAGWDWIQPIRDRNTGIWDKVFIEKTRGLRISNPHVVTSVPGKRKPDETQRPAVLKISAEVENPTTIAQEGRLSFQIEGHTIEKNIRIPAESKALIRFDDFELHHPKLWWPSGYGDQHLYKTELEASTKEGVSDREELSVGIREISHQWNDRTRSMQVLVNGQKIFIKGGNWIVSDAMLRFSEERYDAEIRFHRDMNLNLIRIWGGALAERPEFYEACDRYGLLVMQDFWMSGDANGRWVDPKKKEDQWTRRKYPDDHQLFLESAKDVIKMIRNHPSLAFWVGGNEIAPPTDILEPLRDSILPQYDGTRTLIDYSNSDLMSYNFIGGNGDGPYGIQDPVSFWEKQTFPFNSEVGSIGVGDAASLKRFLPEENWTVPIENKGREAVQDSVWTYHKYIGYKNSLEPYGGAKSMEEFATKAQLVNYDQYRSMAEGFSSHMWDWYTGFIIWKTQNPWTALRGQMYDYYLDPNAGLYGLREGSKPLHVSYNPATSDIFIANNTFEKAYDIMLKAEFIDMKGNEHPLTQVFSYIEEASIKPMLSIKKAIERLAEKEGGFLNLELLDSDQNILDRNFYWLPNKEGDYSGLQNLKKAEVDAELIEQEENKVSIRLSVQKKQPVAFFMRISLLNEEGVRVLPTFFSANYISLTPDNEEIITLETQEVIKNGYQIEIFGWNVKEKNVRL